MLCNERESQKHSQIPTDTILVETKSTIYVNKMCLLTDNYHSFLLKPSDRKQLAILDCQRPVTSCSNASIRCLLAIQ